MNNGTPSIVFSVDRADASAAVNESARNNAEAAMRARRVSFAEARGVYKGTAERAYIVLDEGDALDLVRRLAYWSRQESILRVGANGEARLETPSGRPLETLGRLTAVPESVALQRDAYTETGGRFYVAV